MAWIHVGRNVTHKYLLSQSVSVVFYQVLNAVSDDVFKENI